MHTALERLRERIEERIEEETRDIREIQADGHLNTPAFGGALGAREAFKEVLDMLDDLDL